MSDTDKENEKLDNEFHRLMESFAVYLSSYNYREKFLSMEWLTKLKKSKSSIDERQLRNWFMKYFVTNQDANINIFSTSPFNEIPKNFAGPLKDLKKLLPKHTNETLNSSEDAKHSHIAHLFKNLSDKGGYLAQQPVPRNGAFFILIFKAANETNNCHKL